MPPYVRSAPSSAEWMPVADLQDEAFTHGDGKVLLGQTKDGRLIGLDDDRHLLTVAGSRAGKGVSVILPNLATYTGSVLVLDPKGENASLTAERRGKGRGVAAGGMGQEVFVLDPFGKAEVAEDYRATFNPLSSLDPNDELFVDYCDSIADALVVSEQGKENDHWSATARLVLRAFIAWVASGTGAQRDLVEVSRLLHLPSAPKDAEEDPDAYFDDLLDAMLDEPDRAEGIPASGAGALLSMGQEERGSVLSTVRQNIGFVSSRKMAETLKGGTREPDLRAWKFGGMSVYLCLPAGLLHRHARFFRLFLNRLLAMIEAEPPVPRDKPKGLMILDEMHVLGHMAQLETAAGLIAGYGVRIHAIWQDFTQAEAIYGKRWETFVGNAGIFTAFGNTDMTTLEYISKRLGTTLAEQAQPQNLSLDAQKGGQRAEQETIVNTPLLAPHEVAQAFARKRNNTLVMLAGEKPFGLRRVFWEANTYGAQT